jgi:activator of HSP90 ATPase
MLVPYNISAPAAFNRRRLLAGLALTSGALLTHRRLVAETPAQAMQQVPSNPEHQKLTSLQNIVPMKASPQRVYSALLDAKQFAACSGMPAEIDPKEGGAFTLFQGQIVGRNIELVPNLRVVQAWRPAHWDPGIYSIAHFELKPNGAGTTIVFDHTGFPAGEFDHLDWGWKNHYWEPLQKFLA